MNDREFGLYMMENLELLVPLFEERWKTKLEKRVAGWFNMEALQ